MAYCERDATGPHCISLVDRDFVSRVEELVSRYGDSAVAAKELEALVNA